MLPDPQPRRPRRRPLRRCVMRVSAGEYRGQAPAPLRANERWRPRCCGRPPLACPRRTCSREDRGLSRETRRRRPPTAAHQDGIVRLSHWRLALMSMKRTPRYAALIASRARPRQEPCDGNVLVQIFRNANRTGRFRRARVEQSWIPISAGTTRSGRRGCAHPTVPPTSRLRQPDRRGRNSHSPSISRRVRRSPPSTSCMDLVRAFSPVKGRSPPEAARLQRALDRAEGSENKARQEVDGSPCRFPSRPHFTYNSELYPRSASGGSVASCASLCPTVLNINNSLVKCGKVLWLSFGQTP